MDTEVMVAPDDSPPFILLEGEKHAMVRSEDGRVAYEACEPEPGEDLSALPRYTLMRPRLSPNYDRSRANLAIALWSLNATPVADILALRRRLLGVGGDRPPSMGKVTRWLDCGQIPRRPKPDPIESSVPRRGGKRVDPRKELARLREKARAK